MNLVHRSLREATADAHARVDSLFGGFDLACPAGYAAFLGAQASAVLPLEASLDAAGAESVTEDWPDRRRAPLLLADLAQLGRDGPAEAGEEIAANRDTGWIAGTLYVLEGSRLGGRMLARRVPPALPRRFLDADQVSGNWRKLLDRLDTILYRPAMLEAAAAAALDAFAAFERAGARWMSKG